MSIINEALKKAGQSILSETKKSPVSPPSIFRLEPLKKKKPVNWGPIFVMSVLVLITAPILAPLFHSSYRTLPPAVAGQEYAHLADKNLQTGSEPTLKAQFGIEEIPLSAPQTIPNVPRMTAALPNFSLNGLVYSNGESYVLINKKVIKVGERVGGATLVKVTPDSAVLDYQGETIVLQADA